MENRKNRSRIILKLPALLILFSVLIQLLPDTVIAEDIKPAKARVKGISRPEMGEVTIKRDGDWEVLYRCERVKEGESIRVGKGGWVELRFLNKGDRIRMASLSGIVIEKMVRRGKERGVKALLTLKRGSLRVRLDKGFDSTVTVRTENAEVTIEKGDCIIQYDGLSNKSLIVVKALYDGGSVLVNTPKIFRKDVKKDAKKDAIRDAVSVPEGKKIEITGDGEGLEVKDVGIELALFGMTMKFVDEAGFGVAKAMPKKLGTRGEKPSINIKGEAERFTRKFVDNLNGESVSGIRGMVSSHYTGNIGGFGSRTALINGLKEHFESGKRSRLTYSVGNVGTTDESGGEIIIEARIGTNDVKLWITKGGSSYLLTHAEGRWFYD